MRVTPEGVAVGSIDRAALEALQKSAESVATEPGTAEDAADAFVNDLAAQYDLDALRAQAEQLGIKVDGRWGAERLRQEIADEQEND